MNKPHFLRSHAVLRVKSCLEILASFAVIAFLTEAIVAASVGVRIHAAEGRACRGLFNGRGFQRCGAQQREYT